MKGLSASFIIPTLNSEKYIGRCISSIEKQTLPKSKYEVLILDGGSNDATLKIVKNYKNNINLKIRKNHKVDAESGKYQGIKESKGEIIILLDSDNEIISKKWLDVGIKIMNKHKEVWGLESPWIINKKDPIINQYFALLKIADPVARLLNPARRPINAYKDYQLFKLRKSDTVVTGANGFFWRKSVIMPYIDKIKKFEEVNFATLITRERSTYLAKLTNMGIYHYYCDSLPNYFGKRMKIANKFITRKKLKQATWVDNISRIKLLLVIIYSISIVGPLLESLINIVRNRNISWVYHPLVSFLTVIIYSYAFLKRDMMARFNI